VKRYVEELIAEAAQKGYVTTLFGRKRPVPELSNKNRTVSSWGAACSDHLFREPRLISLNSDDQYQEAAAGSFLRHV